MVPGRSPGGAYGDMVSVTSRPFDHGLAQGGFLPPSCIMQQEQSRIGEKRENTYMEGELQHCLSEEGSGLPNHREKSVGWGSYSCPHPSFLAFPKQPKSLALATEIYSQGPSHCAPHQEGSTAFQPGSFPDIARCD